MSDVRMTRMGPGGSKKPPKPPPIHSLWIDGRRWLTATTGIDLLAFPSARGDYPALGAGGQRDFVETLVRLEPEAKTELRDFRAWLDSLPTQGIQHGDTVVPGSIGAVIGVPVNCARIAGSLYRVKGPARIGLGAFKHGAGWVVAVIAPAFRHAFVQLASGVFAPAFEELTWVGEPVKGMRV